MGWGHVKVLIGAKSCGIFENISSLRTFEKKNKFYLFLEHIMKVTSTDCKLHRTYFLLVPFLESSKDLWQILTIILLPRHHVLENLFS